MTAEIPELGARVCGTVTRFGVFTDAGSVLVRLYDDNGNTTEVHAPGGRTTTYSYDQDGNRTSATDPLTLPAGEQVLEVMLPKPTEVRVAVKAGQTTEVDLGAL